MPPTDLPRTLSDVAPDASVLRSFPQLLAYLERGELANDLSAAQRDLVAALNDAHAAGAKTPAGAITLTLAFRLEDGAIDIKTEFKAKAPKLARGRTVLWTTPNNELTPANPRQHAMAFQDIPGRPRNITTA